MIIRDRNNGRIVGVVKQRPEWASEDNLKRIILLPAARYMSAAQAFFQRGQSTIEIARELGISKHAVRMFLSRIRKAAGAPRERLTAARRDRISKVAFESLTQDGLQLNHTGRVRRSKGRHFEDSWANSNNLLIEVIMTPALEWFAIARRYWVMGETAKQIASALGMSYRAVEGIIAVIRRHAQNPHIHSRVLLAKTRSGRTRRPKIASH